MSALQGLLGPIEQRLQPCEDNVKRLHTYLEIMQFGTLPALAAMSTLQWAQAQRCTGMTPRLLAEVVSEVERQHQLSVPSKSTEGASGVFVRLFLQLPCQVMCAFFAVGSWVILCILDLCVAWRSNAASAEGPIWESRGIALTVLVIACLVLLTSCFCTWRRRVTDHGERLRTAPSCFMFWATLCLLHGTLVGGGFCWLTLHAVRRRYWQVWVGIATLYALISLAVLHCKAATVDHRLCFASSSGSVATKCTNKLNVPAATAATTSQEEQKVDLPTLPFKSSSNSSSQRWRPLFGNLTPSGPTKPLVGSLVCAPHDADLEGEAQFSAGGVAYTLHDANPKLTTTTLYKDQMSRSSSEQMGFTRAQSGFSDVSECGCVPQHDVIGASTSLNTLPSNSQPQRQGNAGLEGAGGGIEAAGGTPRSTSVDSAFSDVSSDLAEAAPVHCECNAQGSQGQEWKMNNCSALKDARLHPEEGVAVCNFGDGGFTERQTSPPVQALRNMPAGPRGKRQGAA